MPNTSTSARTATKKRMPAPSRPSRPRPTTKTVSAPPTVFEFRLLAAQLGAALGAVTIATPKDDWRPILNSVQVKRDGDTLVLTCTDSYRIHTVTLDLSEDESTLAAIPADWSMLISAERAGLRWALDMCKGEGWVYLKVTPTSVTLTDDTRSVVLPHVEGDFVKWEGLVPTDRSIRASKPVSFQPRYMADACRAVRLIGVKDTAIRMTDLTDPLKPVLWEATSSRFALSFAALVMPVRVS